MSVSIKYSFWGTPLARFVLLFSLLLVGVLIIIGTGSAFDGAAELLLRAIMLIASVVGALVFKSIRRRTHDDVVDRIINYGRMAGWTLDPLQDVLRLYPTRFMVTNGVRYAGSDSRHLVLRKEFEGQPTYLTFVEYYIPGPKNSRTLTGLVVVLRHLEAPVLGIVRAVSNTSLLRNLAPDIELESHEFNQDVHLTASNEKLATYVFSPNVMAWYLNEKNRPYVHLEGSRLCVIADQEITYEYLDDIVRQVNQLAKEISRSGALEKSL